MFHDSLIVQILIYTDELIYIWKWNELIWAQYDWKRSITIFDTHFVWCYFILWFSTSIRNNFLLETCSGHLSTSDTLAPQIYAPGLDGRHPRPVEKRPFCARYLPLTSFCTQTLIWHHWPCSCFASEKREKGRNIFCSLFWFSSTARTVVVSRNS